MIAESPLPNTTYTILLNNKDMGSISVPDIKTFMSKCFPYVPYEQEGNTIKVAATKEQIQEITNQRVNRFRGHVIRD